jgi:hypothetical protein
MHRIGHGGETKKDRSMVHLRALASICASIALGAVLLLVPKVVAAHGERINVTAVPVRGEYYFAGQTVPDTVPASKERDERTGQPDTCQNVADWAGRSGASPINSDVDVRIRGPVDTDVDVLEVIARVDSQRSVAGPIRIRCPELVHDQLAPDYQVDFAQSGTAAPTRPLRQVPLRSTSMWCVLPLADCGEASLRVAVRGVERTEYRYYLQITYLVGREKRTSIIGDTSAADSSTQPLRTVIERDSTGDRYLDWAPKSRSWQPVN